MNNLPYLTSTHLERLADVLVWGLHRARRKAGPHAIYQPGDIVALSYERPAASLAERVYARLLKQGFKVVVRPMVHFNMEPVQIAESDDGQLSFMAPWDRLLNESLNGLIALYAPESLTHMKDSDARKMSLRTQLEGKLRAIRDAREVAGLFGRTLCELPTEALAAQAQMSLEEYAGQVIKACYLDDEDPVSRWQTTMSQVDRVKAWLNEMPIDYVHVQTEDGETDLKVWLGERRRWVGGTGRNIPSFEVFTSPAAGRAEGRYHACEPSFKDGRYVRDVRLTFRDGVIAEVSASAEQDFVREALNVDEGARRLGEFSLTDSRFSEITRFMASTLYDENVGGPNGNCHIAAGQAYADAFNGDPAEYTPELAGQLLFNKSDEHWDLVTTAPRTVTAHLHTGEAVVIYRQGQFTLEM